MWRRRFALPWLALLTPCQNDLQSHALPARAAQILWAKISDPMAACPFPHNECRVLKVRVYIYLYIVICPFAPNFSLREAVWGCRWCPWKFIVRGVRAWPCVGAVALFALFCTYICVFIVQIYWNRARGAPIILHSCALPVRVQLGVQVAVGVCVWLQRCCVRRK